MRVLVPAPSSQAQPDPAETLVNETLADLRNEHPLVSKLALQRFAANLRRLKTQDLENLRASLLVHRNQPGISPQEKEVLQRMDTLVSTAQENRRLQAPRMTAPLSEYFPAIGRSIPSAWGN